MLYYFFALQYYEEVTEVEAWLQDHLLLVSSKDYGRDETSTQSLLKRHEAVELELENHIGKVDELKERSETLISEHNFDSVQIKKRQVPVLLHTKHAYGPLVITFAP